METKQIRLCGFGGQGIVLAGRMLGRAGVAEGKSVSSNSSYGPQARGGACRSDVVISGEPIVFPQVIETDILVAMSQEAYNKYVQGVVPNRSLVIYDENVQPKEIENVEQISIPATKVAVEELGNEIVANVVILGAIAEITGVVSREALISSIKESAPGRFIEMNVKALDIGFNLGKEKITNAV